MPEKNLYIALSSVHPGRSSDYIEWYFDKHLPDMTAIPGVENGQFYQTADENKRWEFVGFFQCTRSNAEVLSDASSRAQSGVMRMTDTSDPQSIVMIDAVMQTPHDTVPSADAGGRCVLGLNADVDKDDLAAWSRIDGVSKVHVAALAPEFGPWKAPWRTLVLCDVRNGEAGTARAVLAKASPLWAAPENYVAAFERLQK